MTLDLPMPVRRIAANPNVKDDVGQLAIQRGPLVYCLEACDQGEPLASLYLPAGAKLEAEKRTDLLGGVVVVKGMAESAAERDWTDTPLPARRRPRRRCRSRPSRTTRGTTAGPAR